MTIITTNIASIMWDYIGIKAYYELKNIRYELKDIQYKYYDIVNGFKVDDVIIDMTFNDIEFL